MRKFTQLFIKILPMLFVAFGLFGINEAAWGAVTNSGTSLKQVTISGSTYHVVMESTDERETGTSTTTKAVSRSNNAPAYQLLIELKRVTGSALFDQNTIIQSSANGSSYSDVATVNLKNVTSYQYYGPYTTNIARDTKYIRLKWSSGTKSRMHRNVYLTMASYCETATTELSYGSKTYLTEDTLSFTINWSNKADAQLSISGTDASHYEIIEATAAGNKYIGCAAGKYGYTTVKVRYKRDAVGTHNSATLSGGGISIALKGSTTAGTPTIDCSKVSASTLTYGQKLSESTISGPNASYKGGSYAGTYSWKRSDASTHVAQGCTNYVVKFTPTNTNLNSVECTSVQVPITKVSQTITWNQETTYFIDQNATLSASTTGNTNVYFTSGDESIATISGNTVVMKKAGDVVITAHADTTCNYNAASTVSYTLQFRNRPTISWTLTGENDHIYSGDTLVNLALTSYGTTNLNLPLTYSANPANLVHIPTTLDSVIVKECTENKTCTITASFAGNGTYCAAEATHTYTFEPKITPVMKMSGKELSAESNVLHLLINDTVHFEFEGIDETKFSVPQNPQYVTYVHDAVNHKGVLTGVKFGNEGIQFSQAGTDRIFSQTRSVQVFVEKHPITLTTPMGGTWKVDSIYDGVVYTVNTPGAGEPAMNPVSVTAKHNNVLQFVDGHWKAIGAGKDTLVIAQQANDYWAGDTIEAVITVEKYTPEFTWNLPATVNYNMAFAHPVSSTNEMEECTFSYTSNSTSVINWTNGALRTFEKAGNNIAVEVTQQGNYKWNSKSQTFYVDVAKLPNHVEINMNTQAVRDAVYSGKANKGSISCSTSGKITLNQNGGIAVWTANPLYYDIHFTGVPKNVTFTYSQSMATSTAIGATGKSFIVYESSNGSNWSEVWSSDGALGNTSTHSTTQTLDPSTQYLRFFFDGTYAGYYENIIVRERTEIRSGKDKLDFGSTDAGSDPTDQNVNISWYNVNPLTLSIKHGSDKYSVSPASIASSKDNYAVGVPVTVSYKHTAGGTHVDTLVITDGDVTKEIALTGTTNKVTPEITWKENLSPMSRGENVTDPATSLVTLVYTSSDSTVVDVEGNVLKPLKKGNATITASFDGTESLIYNSTSSTKDVLVTNLAVQHIHWTQTFTRLKWSNDPVLSEKNTPDFDFDATVSYYDPETEQEVEITDRAISYTSGNEAVVKVLEGNKLHVVGQGNTTLTAHIDGITDSLYEATVIRDVIVREPTLDCEKWVLENKSASMATEINSFSGVETVYDLSGEPGYLSFEAWREAIRVLFTDWTGGNLFVAEKIGNDWHELTGEDGLALDLNYENRKAFDSIPMSREATQVKIYKKTGSTGIHAFSGAYVTLARYLELENTKNRKTHSIYFSTEDAKPGVAKTKTFTVNYSNITDVLDIDLKHGDKFSIVGKDTIGAECGNSGKKTVTVQFLSDEVDNYKDTLLIHNLTDTVYVYLSADVDRHHQQITWEQDTIIATTDNVICHATTTASDAGLQVRYYVTEGEAATVDETKGALSILTDGSVKVEARCEGNGKYYDATPVSKTFVISKVKPSITEVPIADTMTLPNTLLENCLLSGGAVSVDGSFAWDDNTISATLNNSGYKVNFTPDNTNWYDTASCMVVVPVEKQAQVITWNFVDTVICNAKYQFDATSNLGLKVSYRSSDNSIAYVDDNDSLRIIKGGDVTITAYQNGTDDVDKAEDVVKNLHIHRFTPTIVTLPTAATMKIGRLLDNATLTGGRAELEGVEVEGTFSWVDGDVTTMDVAGEFTKAIVFTPANINYYESVDTVLNVTVEKYAPKLSDIALSGSTINYGQALSYSNLSGTLTATDTVKVPNVSVDGSIVWKNETAIPNTGNPSHATAVFRPTDTDWYTEVEIANVPLVVHSVQAANYTATAMIVYGERLSEANDRFTNTTTGLFGELVSGTITWAEAVDQTQVLAEGEHQIAIRFHSNNPNYVDGDGICTLTVTPGKVFNGGTNGDDNTWGDLDNWLGGDKPGTDDRVTIDADVEITGDVTIGGLTINDGYTVTVAEGATLTVGDDDSFLRDGYGNLYVENGGQVILGTGEVKVKNFTIEAQLGSTNENITSPSSSGQVKGSQKLDVQGDAYFQLAVDPSGRNTYGWYDFVVPFEVDVIGGISIAEAPTTPMQFNVNYAVMAYDESKRAVNGKDWTKFSGTMEPGRVYTITLDETQDWNTVVFKKKQGAPVTGDRSFTTSCSDLGEDVDRGWNGFGNGSLRHMELDVPEGTLVQVYDHTNRCYRPREAKDMSIAVGLSFFMQVDGVQTIELSPAVGNTQFLAPKRVKESTDKFRLALTAEGAANASDYLWVSASEEATGDYVIGRDVLKMGTMSSSKVARMWSSRNGINLCSNEMQMVNDKAECKINLYAPNAGSYTLGVENEPSDAALYLTYNGKAIWSLSASPYQLDLEAGTTEGYGLRVVAVKQTPAITTGMDAAETENIRGRKVIIDNVLYIITPEGAMYDLLGKSVKF